VFTPVSKNVFISYDDLADFSLLCYPLEEVLIEKMCALMGRTEPRDLYDLWYLLEIAKLEAPYYWPEFAQKAQHKGHKANQFTARLEEKLLNFRARWEGSLAAQIHWLPPFDQVVTELGKHLRQIKKLAE
jgi:predicted nucleotidyltransferase component of viral defense system